MDRYESRIDRQIREAQERGEFDALPGLGRPLPGAGEHYDEDWWLKQWIHREGLASVMLPSHLRKRDGDGEGEGGEAEGERAGADGQPAAD